MFDVTHHTNDCHPGVFIAAACADSPAERVASLEVPVCVCLIHDRDKGVFGTISGIKVTASKYRDVQSLEVTWADPLKFSIPLYIALMLLGIVSIAVGLAIGI